jgi:glycosyltransferase involved in cell wall biosynthesis
MVGLAPANETGSRAAREVTFPVDRDPTRRRIAIYLPSLRGGGAERSTVTLANGIAARGYTVDLVLASAEGPYLQDVSSSIRVVDLRSRRVVRSLPRLIGYLRAERPKAMLSVLNHANVIALVARRIAGTDTRLIVSERNTPNSFQWDTRFRRARLMPWLMRRTYPMADGIVCVSAGIANDIVSLIGAGPRAQVIYNPVVTEELLARGRMPFDHPWLAPGQPPVVLAAGRLTPQKDFETLILAFAGLRAMRPARLVILGEGELRDELQALISRLGLTDDVSLPGFADNPFAWMRRSALFVLSSAWEGLPGVLIQAMASGLRVVSTDCPSGPAEILDNGKWGRLVPVGDPRALARAMAEALDDPAPPDVRIRAADFGVDRAVDAYLKALQIAPDT